MDDDYDPAQYPQKRHQEPPPEPPEPVEVRVTGPWQVQYSGLLLFEGQQGTVPEPIAAVWEQSGWVERVEDKPQRSKTTKPKE